MPRLRPSSLLLLPTHSLLILTISLSFAAVTTSGQEEIRHRMKRAPAVWGAPPPDYRSLASLGDGRLRYLYTVLFVDAKIMEHYENDFVRAKAKVLLVVEEANRYLNQLNVALTVLDILPMTRSDFSLYSFQEFRNQRLELYQSHHSARRSVYSDAIGKLFPQLHKLPDHDFAVLFTYKYAGGLAFVDGMCSPQSVMLCGFFPQEPRAMGGIFFHEIAHLLGVPHKSANASIYVPNCECPAQKRLRRSIKSEISNESVNDPGCLKIPGFDHDCTAQQFVNALHKSRCVRTESEEIMKSSPICGNSVLEDGEDCDCGIKEVCSRWNCVPDTCSYRIHPVVAWLLAILISVALFSLFSFFLHRRGLLAMFTSCYKKKKKGAGTATAYASTLLSDDMLKHPFPSHLRKTNSYGPASLHDSSSSVVVLLDRPPRVAGLPSLSGSSTTSSTTLQRPRAPPPPPPKTRIAVQSANNHGYEIPIKHPMYPFDQNAPAPRCSMEPDSISWKFDSFDSDDDEGTTNTVAVPHETGVPCRPNYPSHVPINRILVSTIPCESDGTLSTDCPSSSSSGDVKL